MYSRGGVSDLSTTGIWGWIVLCSGVTCTISLASTHLLPVTPLHVCQPNTFPDIPCWVKSLWKHWVEGYMPMFPRVCYYCMCVLRPISVFGAGAGGVLMCAMTLCACVCGFHVLLCVGWWWQTVLHGMRLCACESPCISTHTWLSACHAH